MIRCHIFYCTVERFHVRLFLVSERKADEQCLHYRAAVSSLYTHTLTLSLYAPRTPRPSHVQFRPLNAASHCQYRPYEHNPLFSFVCPLCNWSM